MFTSRSNGGWRVTSAPWSRIRPSVGSSKPAIIRSVVVLPEPDGPSIEKNSPSRTSRSMPSTATTGRRRTRFDRRRHAGRRVVAEAFDALEPDGDATRSAMAAAACRDGGRCGTRQAGPRSGAGPRRALRSAVRVAPHCAARGRMSSGRGPCRRRADSRACSGPADVAPVTPARAPAPRVAAGRARRPLVAARCSLAACDAGAPPATPPIAPGHVGRARARSTSSPRTTRSCPIRSTSSPARPSCSTSSTAASRSTRSVIGDSAVQDAWEVAEAAAAGAPPGPTPVVSVPPDVAGLRIVVAVRPAGRRHLDGAGRRAGRRRWLVGCHIPGHWAKGMQVPVASGSRHRRAPGRGTARPAGDAPRRRAATRWYARARATRAVAGSRAGSRRRPEWPM